MPLPPSSLDPTPYGLDLAGQVAEALWQGHASAASQSLANRLGFAVVDGHFRYEPSRVGHGPSAQLFATQAAFVQWLAAQSDAHFGNLPRELAGADYPPVTRQRLRELVPQPAGFTPTQRQLNELLTHLLTSKHCWGGRLQASFPNGAALVSLTGHHATGKDVLVTPIELPLKRLLTQYAAETPGGLGQLQLVVDLPRATFHYQGTSVAAQARADKQAAAAAAQAQLAQHQQHRQYLRQHLSAEPYGLALAGQVAEALAQGLLLEYPHSDYGGFGFDVQQGHYRYGVVWDGALEEVKRTFASRPAFVGWLARQSDVALAQLRRKDAWWWHNQTVTRARLLELVQGLPTRGTAPTT